MENKNIFAMLLVAWIIILLMVSVGRGRAIRDVQTKKNQSPYFATVAYLFSVEIKDFKMEMIPDFSEKNEDGTMNRSIGCYEILTGGSQMGSNSGLKFNPDKCEITVENATISYYGRGNNVNPSNYLLSISHGIFNVDHNFDTIIIFYHDYQGYRGNGNQIYYELYVKQKDSRSFELLQEGTYKDKK